MKKVLQDLRRRRKDATFLDEDEVPLSEFQKAMLMKDTSGVIQQPSKASDTLTPSKLHKAINLFVIIL